MRQILHIVSFICLCITLSLSASAQKVGLVLSGGGAKGLTHIGIIRALEENNIPLVSNKVIHAIFSMSNEDIKCYYKISLEEIIDKYYNKHLQKNRSFKTY